MSTQAVKPNTDIKVPLAPAPQPQAPAAAADPWCCSSCESLCGSVPCMGSVCELAHEAWNGLVYFVQWMFGCTVLQRGESFYAKWSAIDPATAFQEHLTYNQHMASWAADLRALPEEILLPMLDKFGRGDSPETRNTYVRWPAQQSLVGEPFTAEEREAVVSYLCRDGRTSDSEIVAYVRTRVDKLRARALPDDNARIDFFCQIWAGYQKPDSDRQSALDKLRWLGNLKLLDGESSRFAALAFANKVSILVGSPTQGQLQGKAPIKQKNVMNLHIMLEGEVGCSDFLDALQKYKQNPPTDESKSTEYGKKT